MSHLSTLIKRIDRADESSIKWRLLNLAEYMVHYTDYTKDESTKAVTILNEHDFNTELSHQGIERKYVELAGLSNFHSRTCLRCGRSLSNPISVRKGLGPVCRSKAKRGDWGDKETKNIDDGATKLSDHGFMFTKKKR